MTATYAVDYGEASPLHGANFTAPETSVVLIRGLHPGDEVVIGEARGFSEVDGVVQLALAALQVVGQTSATVWRGNRDIARATIEIAPAKMRHAEFETLWRELHEVWLDLLLRAHTTFRAVEHRVDIPRQWRRARPIIESICAHPQVKLIRGRATAPYARARDVDFTPSRTLALGVALRQELPVRPIVGSVDIPANRLVARLCEAIAAAAEREGHAGVANDARRMRDHATLRELRADHVTSPDPVVAKDQRYLRCWHELRRLTTPAAFNTTGPFPSPIGLVRLPALYEYWVYLRIALGVEAELGAPVGRGYDVLGRDRGGDRRELRLLPGTRIEFPDGVSVVYEPEVSSAKLDRQDEGFTFSPATHPVNRVRPMTRVTPDVVVSGPGGILVVDAKYVGVNGLASTAQTLHAKYGGIQASGDVDRRTHEVVVAHPNADAEAIEFAGYAALPMVPGTRPDWLAPRVRRLARP